MQNQDDVWDIFETMMQNVERHRFDIEDESDMDDMVCESSNELYITTNDLINMYETFEL